MNNQVKVNEATTGTYKSIEIKVGRNTWSFMQVSGLVNYISVRKQTNNPFATLGKEFKNWSEVEEHYQSADMQMAIFSAQSALSN